MPQIEFLAEFLLNFFRPAYLCVANQVLFHVQVLPVGPNVLKQAFFFCLCDAEFEEAGGHGPRRTAKHTQIEIHSIYYGFTAITEVLSQNLQ